MDFNATISGQQFVFEIGSFIEVEGFSLQHVSVVEDSVDGSRQVDQYLIPRFVSQEYVIDAFRERQADSGEDQVFDENWFVNQPSGAYV